MSEPLFLHPRHPLDGAAERGARSRMTEAHPAGRGRMIIGGRLVPRAPGRPGGSAGQRRQPRRGSPVSAPSVSRTLATLSSMVRGRSVRVPSLVDAEARVEEQVQVMQDAVAHGAGDQQQRW